MRKVKGKIRKNRKVKMGDQEEDYERETNRIFVHNSVHQNMHVQVLYHHESLLRQWALNNYRRHLLRFGLVRVILLYIPPHSKQTAATCSTDITTMH